MKRDSFVIRRSFYEPLKGLNSDVKGVLFDAICNYALDEIIPEKLPPESQMAFGFIRLTIDRDAEKYQEMIDRNRANGVNGGRPSKNPKEPKKPSGLSGNPTKPTKPDTVFDYVFEDDIKENKLSAAKIFESFRGQYPGKKGGFEIEYKNFIKKNKPEVAELLLPALNNEKKNREKALAVGAFVPEWKHLSTWINNKCWVQELPEPTPRANGYQGAPKPKEVATRKFGPDGEYID